MTGFDVEAQRTGFMNSSNRRILAEAVIRTTLKHPHLDEDQIVELLNEELENSREEGAWSINYPGVRETVIQAMMRTREAVAEGRTA